MRTHIRPSHHHLERFVQAQRAVYADVRWELQTGYKTTHWMWFIFPQLEALGFSPNARFYGIRSLAEARAYLAHPVLGRRLIDCTLLLLDHDGLSAEEILGEIDAIKLRSSMTLFAAVTGPGSIFTQVTDRFFGGTPDPQTLALLGA